MSFIPQSGLSNLICSSNMNVGVAVNTVKELCVVINGENEQSTLTASNEQIKEDN